MNYPILSIFLGVVAGLLVATSVGNFIWRKGFLQPPNGDRIGSIDGLRGYLALTVLGHHFIIWLQVQRLGGTWAPPTVKFFEQMGAGAVALFFMTTGLVFYPRVLDGWHGCSWKNVYISRIFRLIPLIGVSIALITLLICYRTGAKFDSHYPMAALKWLVTLGEPPILGYADSGRLNAYVLWSLQYEWIFYLAILPICAFFMDKTRKSRRPTWLVPMGLLLVAVGTGIFLSFDKIFNLPANVAARAGGLSAFVPCFAVGMLAHECRNRPRLASVLRGKWAIFFALIGLFFSANLFFQPYGLALPAYAFFFVCVACGNDLGGILKSKGALVLGECSYGIYLMHGVALSLLYVEFHDLIDRLPVYFVPALIPIVTAVVVIFSALTYQLVELPAIGLGKRIIRGRRGELFNEKVKQT